MDGVDTDIGWMWWNQVLEVLGVLEWMEGSQILEWMRTLE